MLIGVPEYRFIVCINYIYDKLKSNGFSVNFYKPNLLLISWKDWVPELFINDIKKLIKVLNLEIYNYKLLPAMHPDLCIECKDQNSKKN